MHLALLLTCQHNVLSFVAGPPLNTEPTSRDWVVAQGYAMAQLTPRRTSNLSLELYGPANGTFTSWQLCRDNCSRMPGCASFQWLPSTGACRHYMNEPNATNLLLPCNGNGSADCVFGYRLPGSCGRSASASIQ